MHLFPPERQIAIYEEGFGGDDLLNRQASGKRLSELLEKVVDPVVVALDGPWGSGKSHFLKRWVGAHRLENNGTATTVYFDAFANDFLDDPLIGLTAAISDRLPSGKDRSQWALAKKAAAKLARPILRIGAATATAGATEIAGPVVDAVITAGSKELEAAADEFWRREDGRKAAMQQFRSALCRLTESSKAELDDGKPLIVVIDELDRCRPDYALATLEVVKHFFSVKRAHFVLGININALENIVRTRYGCGIDASQYLTRFISLSMHLPEFVSGRDGLRVQLQYFKNSAKLMGINQSLIDVTTKQLNLSVNPSRISLRDIEKIMTMLSLLPHRRRFGEFTNGWQVLVISLVLFRVLRPEYYRKAMSGTLTIHDVDEFYGIVPNMLTRNSGQNRKYDHGAFILRGLWEFTLSGGTEPAQHVDDFSRSLDSFGMRDADRILPDIERDFFGLFEVVETTT